MRPLPYSSLLIGITALTSLGGCVTPPWAARPSQGHLTAANAPPAAKDIPVPVQTTVVLPRPKAAAKVETYSVSVRAIPVDELLFALARDARLNIDLHPGINGTVTINAIDQTLQQILTRIAKQVDMRWELDGPNLAVMPDSPFLRTYRVDYVNMSRDVQGTVSINTQIASTSAGTTGATAVAGNNSSTTVNSKARNNFWDSLEKNVKDLLRETDKTFPEGSSETVVERSESQSTSGDSAMVQALRGATAARANTASPTTNVPASLASEQQGATTVRRTTFREAASVIVNPEAGVVVVRATSRQHEKVQEYIDLVTRNSRRQVMIEATIVEVGLSDKFEQGIDWSVMPTGSAGTKFSVSPTSGMTVNSYNTATDKTSALSGVVLKGVGVIAGSIKLLENFGTVKVLSSPKISVLNNQTAMLKVVNNYVYFNVASNTTMSASGPSQTTVTTTPHSVSIGLVMSVTPQVGESDTVLLNVRPTISSLFGAGKKDPNPSIPQGLENVVPEIQTREMESMLRLSDGEIAIMGGLMEDKIDNTGTSVPLLGDLPGIGALFGSRTDKRTKTELVVFLRPTIIRDSSVNGDYRELKRFLPSDGFMGGSAEQDKSSGRPRTEDKQ